MLWLTVRDKYKYRINRFRYYRVRLNTRIIVLQFLLSPTIRIGTFKGEEEL